MHTPFKKTAPYQTCQIKPKIKPGGGRFEPSTKKQTLTDSPSKRDLAESQRPIASPSPEERVKNVTEVAVQLLNALHYRQYRLIESGDRIVIEAAPVVG